MGGMAAHYTERSTENKIMTCPNCGSDRKRSGRDGHWGLRGMRERTERIGARLDLRSRAMGGTEVEFVVPSHIAFAA